MKNMKPTHRESILFPMTPLVERALQLAELGYAGHLRRDSDVSVLEGHLIPVANTAYDIVRRCYREAGLDIEPADAEVVLAVALLHDSLEDSAVSTSDIDQLLDGEVFGHVDSLTHDGVDPYRQYIEKLCERALDLQDPTTVVVKLADMLSNLADDPTAAQRARYTSTMPRLVSTLASIGIAR